jgi:hexulose-6-phosphate isomerase
MRTTETEVPRRAFLCSTVQIIGAVTAVGMWGRTAAFAAKPDAARIYKSIKFGMFSEEVSYREKFEVLKELGFDGVELDNPFVQNKEEAIAASRAVGLPIHGVVDPIHWGTRLSDPDASVRAQALDGLKRAIKDSHTLGGSSVLLVPGKVADEKNENQQQVWDRTIVGIRAALPLASRLGIHILIENVWNGFCYKHNGPDNQTADQLARYIDAIDSPWVGVYFDIGNHRKYGKPEEWIRTLGKRIVKLDIKDWGKKNNFCKIGDGDVDWDAVRAALRETRFTGWSTAEVAGGDRKRMREIAMNMDKVLGL